LFARRRKRGDMKSRTYSLGPGGSVLEQRWIGKSIRKKRQDVKPRKKGGEGRSTCLTIFHAE